MPDAPHPTDKAIGARVRIRREAARQTQAQLAAAIGVTFQQVQKYERGANRISASRLMQIADALNTSTSSLLRDQGMGSVDSAIELLDMPGAVDLLMAFKAIPSPRHRQGLLAMAKSLEDVA